MNDSTHRLLAEVGGQFDIAGSFTGGAPYGSGHINDTFVAEYRQPGDSRRYILQRLNGSVFPDLEGLMVNICRVLDHQHRKVGDGGRLKAMELVPTRQGASFFVDRDNRYWRVYRFVENASSHDIIPSARHASSAAQAFGEFQGQLAGLPPTDLSETIPDFHDTEKRFERLAEAIERDAFERSKLCPAEIGFAMNRAAIVSTINTLMDNGQVPERIAHNDTKLNNVMLDDETGEGVCVIDLDTVMPGTILYDFGDMVRTATMPVAEDETDLSTVVMNMDMFEAIAEGYLAGTRDWLTTAERENLALAARITTFETGIRFLTDFLEGDTYFRIHRPNHNLDRCRTQFALVESIEKNYSRMQDIVNGI